MYYPQQNLLHVHIPKTGGTSILEGLLAKDIAPHPDIHGTGERGDHRHIQWFANHLTREEFDAAYRFAVYRHPYDLFVSSYHYRRDRLPYPNSNRIPKWVTFEQWMTEHVATIPLEWEEELTDCLKFGQINGEWSLTPWRFDQLPDLWEELLRRCELPSDTPLPHQNETQHPPAIQFFHNRTDLKDIVWKRCHKGVEYFGWER